MTDEDMKVWVAEAGVCLAKNVCAGTAQNALLRELQDFATAKERKVIASLIFELVG